MARLHRTLLRSLVDEIVGGVVAVEARLPTEKELARRFGVSRGVAREGIRGLEERGLVSVRHGSGATVLPTTEWDMFNPDVIAAVLEGSNGPAILREYLECRRLLEIEAAGIAAAQATPDQLDALSDALARMTTAVEASAEDRFHEADVAFHRGVVHATGNRAFGTMTEPVHRALAVVRMPLARPADRLERCIPEHREIVAAIAAGDSAGARSAMRDHLLAVERYLTEYAALRQEAHGR